MEYIILGILILITLLLVVFGNFINPSSLGLPQQFLYRKLDTLLTPAEQNFYNTLKNSVPDGVIIFGKVRVADVLTPIKGLNKSKWQTAFNKISSKHFDYVLCNQNTMDVLCAIELNDKSHNSIKRQERDIFLQSACDSAQLKLLQIKASYSYETDEIKSLITEVISNSELNADKKDCLKCSAKMVLRVANRGSNKGKQFWGCSNYPNCKYTEPLTIERPKD